MRLFIETHGCRANQYDSEAVLELARRAGYEVVQDASDADVAVVNTCAVTAEAERDARKSVRRISRHSRATRTVVMGCSAALPSSGRTLATLPGVTHVIGGADMAAVAAALGVEASSGTVKQRTVRAQLRVQDGCDEHCTFCATTLARGANRSRLGDALVAEARTLAEHHPEIVITGTHIGTYGLDIGTSLGALMQRLVREVPAVRFRLSSIEATEVDDAIVDVMSTEPMRLAPHVHAPLQSGSNAILKRMGRHWYTAGTYADAVEGMAARLAVLGLGADVIVGFPGETAEDFDATMSVVQNLPFTYLHVFAYSPRQGTAALRLDGGVPAEVTQERSALLRALSAEKAQLHAQRRAGAAADAIVVRAGDRMDAMTEDFLTLPINGARRVRGDRFPARISDAGAALTPV